MCSLVTEVLAERLAWNVLNNHGGLTLVCVIVFFCRWVMKKYVKRKCCTMEVACAFYHGDRRNLGDSTVVPPNLRSFTFIVGRSQVSVQVPRIVTCIT